MSSVKRFTTFCGSSTALLFLLTLFSATAAQAQDVNPDPDVTTFNSYFCGDDVSNVGNCTANEVN